MKKLTIGILAHVDAGKTTLSEAMLYTAGSIRALGRVDRGNTFLDTFELEKKRGITIFSKQARLSFGDCGITLLDTPGHVDFSAETERTLQVLDGAILVISGTDGVQSHTRTLWNLLEKYRVPVFIFVNKMDLSGRRRGQLLDELREKLSPGCLDFSSPDSQDFFENAATAGEEDLEEFLETGRLSDGTVIRRIEGRDIIPCCFGSALKNDGVREFMGILSRFAPRPDFPEEFGARVYKITRDASGNRLTHMKITGGSLHVRDMLGEEKVSQIRLYSGEKFEPAGEVPAGEVCAVTGLTATFPGMAYGCEEEKGTAEPVLAPVLSCRILLPPDRDPAQVLPLLRELSEEEPELQISWNEEKGEIHARVMGEIQTEILKSLIADRFGLSVEFGDRSILYKETIANTVEGIGHYEPLRHYAEVHLLLEPGEQGSGMVYTARCSEDVLDRNWQRLVLTHLEEREHRGVLTGAPLTDVTITLVSGRASLKHTEGGDFRQAVYRAVRQGLMQADSRLLEPYYEFRLEVPARLIGRAMTDLERMHAGFEMPLTEGDRAVLTGTGPVSTMDGYQKEVNAYTGGEGHLTLALSGYGPCHNAEEVVLAAGYDPDADLRNPSGSVFCAHGAGFFVGWDEVKDYMHLESYLTPDKNPGTLLQFEGAGAQANRERVARAKRGDQWIGTDEVDKILNQTFSANKKKDEEGGRNRWGARRRPVKLSGAGYGTGSESREDGAGDPENDGKVQGTKKNAALKPEYLLVDGYNIIFAWQELSALAQSNIDSARDRLQDILCNYQGFKKCEVIVVFDAYRVKGHKTEWFDFHNIHVVYTQEAETADRYIERFAHENASRYRVRVATSDGMEQIIIRGQGAALVSAREFLDEVREVEQAIRDRAREHSLTQNSGGKNYLLDGMSEEEIKAVREDADPFGTG